MSKTQRLIEFMMTVNAKRKFTARGLAEEFGVSYRTILRDLDELSALGVPIYSEVGASGGYYLLNDRTLPPIFFKESEAVAMFFAYQSLQFFGSLPFETETRAALKKFHQYVSEDVKKRIDAMKDRIVFWNPTRPQPSGFLQVILEAAIEQRTVRIDYEGPGETSGRTIQPIGLYSQNGFWYCPAYCFKREAFRLFRADRIHSAKPVTVDKKELPYRSVTDWLQDFEQECPDPVRLKVEFTRAGARRAVSELDLEPFLQVAEDGSGFMNTNIPRSEMAYFGDLLWNFGTEAVVKEPYEMVAQLKQKLADLAKLYSES